MPGYAGLFSGNLYFWNPVCVPDIVHFTGTGKGVAVHCASQKDYSADPACHYFAKIHGGDGIYRAEPIADVISVVTTSVVFIYTMKKVLRNM